MEASVKADESGTVIPSSTIPYSDFNSSSSSYFSCKRCFKDVEKNEPVVTFCGHIFCWSCLYSYISDDAGKPLRGSCPACISAVDLCPRTKTVCPIYAKDKREEEAVKRTDEARTGASLGKGKGTVPSSKGNTITDLDMSKRPGDKRPFLFDSFMQFALLDSLDAHANVSNFLYRCVYEWKSSLACFDEIIKEIEAIAECLPSQLLKEQERESSQGFLRRQSSCRTSIRIQEDFDPAPRSSLCYSYHLNCNICSGDAATNEPVVTYCGHVFCRSCFCTCEFQQCPVCHSAVDICLVCPINVNEGVASESQIRRWRAGVLVLDPYALRLWIEEQTAKLNREIKARTNRLYGAVESIIKIMDNFFSDIRRDFISDFICSQPDFLPEFLEEDGSKEKRATGMQSSSSDILLSTLHPSCRICGCDHPNDPVVTYCSHLFCWLCLYNQIKNNVNQTGHDTLSGPCPACKEHLTVFASTGKVTVIPIYRKADFTSKGNGGYEEQNCAEVPRPVGRSLSNSALKEMRFIVSKSMTRFQCLMVDLRSKIDRHNREIEFTLEGLNSEIRNLLLGLLYGWPWVRYGRLEVDASGIEQAYSRVDRLSEDKDWIEVLDVDLARKKYSKETTR